MLSFDIFKINRHLSDHKSWIKIFKASVRQIGTLHQNMHVSIYKEQKHINQPRDPLMHLITKGLNPNVLLSVAYPVQHNY